LSRDIAVYGRCKELVSIAGVIEGMSKRGMVTTWKSNSKRKTSDWSVGGSVPVCRSGRANDISASAEPLDEAWRQDVVRNYASGIGDAERQSILAAEYIYNLHGPWSTAGGARDHSLLFLADSIAELADGVIIDTLSNRVFSRSAFRKANPSLGRDATAKGS
jgi:hypothetical protein